MPTLGVAVAILNDNRILLIKREDFEVWALPGGGVDAGESLAHGRVSMKPMGSTALVACGVHVLLRLDHPLHRRASMMRLRLLGTEGRTP